MTGEQDTHIMLMTMAVMKKAKGRMQPGKIKAHIREVLGDDINQAVAAGHTPDITLIDMDKGWQMDNLKIQAIDPDQHYPAILTHTGASSSILAASIEEAAEITGLPEAVINDSLEDGGRFIGQWLIQSRVETE